MKLGPGTREIEVRRPFLSAAWWDRQRKTLQLALIYGALALGAIVSLVPLYWLVLTSLRPTGGEFTYPPQWIPSSLHFENYAYVFDRAPFLTYTRNSVFVTVVATVGTLVSGSLAAYAFARLRFIGRDVWFAVMLSTLMLPYAVTMIPEFLLFRILGWLDSLWPLVVPYWFGGGAFYIFLMRQFFLTLPTEMEDAARVDGAGPFRIYLQIVMPLSGPALASVVVFSFIHHWNDFLGPLIYTNSPGQRTLALGLRYFADEQITQFNYTMAASTLMLVPVLILFFLANRYFVRGIATSGLAGR
jgi:ABC-type glycerol-3-phosphate transport system permease component